MVWAIDNDDFGAECSPVRYPLLRTINAELAADAPGGTTTAATTTADPVTKSGESSTPYHICNYLPVAQRRICLIHIRALGNIL